jgi:hypothetical protein|tara:strand:+ start:2017 stop:2691 length:675 start_codon:yes stop_codon:yes gene_type:complete
MNVFTWLYLAALFSFNSTASLITHYDYTLDTATKIVSSKDIHWLRWDKTQGMSVNEALDSNQGWAIANEQQMAGLYNVFFDYKIWTIGDNGGASGQDYTDSITDQLRFIELFGYTNYLPIGDYNGDIYTDAFYQTHALYKSETVEVGAYREAIVNDAFYGTFNMGGQLESYGVGASSELSLPQMDGDINYPWTGIALVKVIAVPEPETVMLFVFSLMILYRRVT